MDKAPEQPDLFDWKPEEKNISQFRKTLNYLPMGILFIIGLIVVYLFLLAFVSFIEQVSLSEPNRKWLTSFILLLLVITLLIIWQLPIWQVKSLDEEEGSESQSKFDLEKERIKLRDDVRKTLAQIIGGVFLALGIFVTYNTFELNRRGQLSERFGKALILLKEENILLRAGGLYSLGDICQEDSGMRLNVLDTIETYVRQKPRPDNKSDMPPATNSNTPPAPEEDMIAIGRILHRNKCVVNPGYDLSAANFTEVNLSNTSLMNVILRDAKLFKTKFISATLVGADLSGTNAAEADFTYANLTDANFTGADVTNAIFEDTNLKGANLKDIKSYSEDKILKARITPNTILPESLEKKRKEFRPVIDNSTPRRIFNQF